MRVSCPLVLNSCAAAVAAYTPCPRPLQSHDAPLGAVTVSANGAVAGSHPTWKAALEELRTKASDCSILFIYEGCYNEHVQVTDLNNLQIIGQISTEDWTGRSYQDNKVTLRWSHYYDASIPQQRSGNSSQHTFVTNEDTSTLLINAGNVSVYNINIMNTANIDGQRKNIIAGALAVSSKDSNSGNGLYAVSAQGWQDTVYFPYGNAIVRNSYINGAVDYVYGRAKVMFQRTVFATKRTKGKVFAHGRLQSTDDTIFVADHCWFDKAPGFDALQFWLARPWSPFSQVVVKNSYLGQSLYPEAWTRWHKNDDDSTLAHVTFGEYNNDGPGSWDNNTAARWAFGHAQYYTTEVFTLDALFPNETWVDHTFDDLQFEVPQSVKLPATASCSAAR